MRSDHSLRNPRARRAAARLVAATAVVGLLATVQGCEVSDGSEPVGTPPSTLAEAGVQQLATPLLDACVEYIKFQAAQGEAFWVQVAAERPGDMHLAEWCSEWGESDPDALANANTEYHAIRAYLENAASPSSTTVP